MKFSIQIDNKTLILNSDLAGLVINAKEYKSTQDGVLVYDKVKKMSSDKVELQMSTNTSTLIPALKVLGIRYNKYFDRRDVIESQNDITFYWNKSRLAAFYNRYSTDRLEYKEREPVIRKAVNFLVKSKDTLILKEEFLNKILENPILLGFYKGFPIFDSSKGLAKLQSRFGIHIDPEKIMISTIFDKYNDDVCELAAEISNITGLKYSMKKNRVSFIKTNKLLKLLGV